MSGLAWVSYQFKFLDDRSPRRIVNKSRRVGFSELAAFCRAARALGLRLRSTGFETCAPANQNLLSASYAQSKALLARVMRHVDALSAGIPGLATVERRTETLVKLSNGILLTALSTNPRTARGYEGDVLLDEWASTPHQKELWAAVHPLAGKTLGNRDGYEIDIVSTPLGDGDLFYKMVEGELRDGWSQHRVTIHEAIKAGFPISPEELERLRLEAGDDEDFAQEYECRFLSASDLYITPDIYAAAEYDVAEAEAAKGTHSLVGSRMYAGIDVARRRDLTSLCRLRKDKDGIAWHDETFAIRGADWDTQEDWVDQRVRGICSGIAVDATGIGSQFAERLAIRFPGQVEQVDFTVGSKEELATGLKLALQRGKLRMRSDDDDTRREVLRLRREVTKAGNIRFDVERDKRGHGDRAWALALALRATGVATRSAPKNLPIKPLPRRPSPPWRENRFRRGRWR